MAKERLCRKCRSPIGIDDDVCQNCGANNPVTQPWWGILLGFVMLALIGYLLVDFSVWIDIAQRLFD